MNNLSASRKNISVLSFCILVITTFTLRSAAQSTSPVWQYDLPYYDIIKESVIDDNNIYHLLVLNYTNEDTFLTQLLEIDSAGNLLSTIIIPTGDTLGSGYLDKKLNSYFFHFGDTTFSEIYSFDKFGNERWHVGADHLAGGLLVNNSGDVFSYSTVYVDGFHFHMVVNKIDSSGTLLWTVHPNTNAQSREEYRDAVVNNSGGIFFTGDIQHDGDAGGFYTIKINSDGTTGWTDESVNGDLRVSNAIALDAAGNSYITGYDYSYGAIEKVITTKLSPLGAEEWSMTDSDENYIFPDDIAVNSEDNVIVCGSRSSFAYITKYSSSGTQLWSADFNALTNVEPIEIAVAPSNNIVMLATQDAGGYWENYNYTTIKYSAAGVLQWYSVYDGPYDPLSEDILKTISFDSHENVIVAGSSYCDDGCDYGQSNVFKFSDDSIICSANFSLVADSLVPHHYWLISYVYGVQPISYLWTWGDGFSDTIVYPSHTYDTAGYYNICLFTVDSTGCAASSCIDYYLQKSEQMNTIITVDVVDSIPSVPTDIQTTNVLESCSVFPNPAAGSVFLNYSLSAPATVNVELFDVIGNKLQERTDDREAGVYNTTFDIKDLPNGIYFLKIHVGNTLASQKIVVMN